jgi:hypothetical protein
MSRKFGVALVVAAVPSALGAGEVGRLGQISTPYGPAFLKVEGDNLYVSTFYNSNLQWKNAPDAVYRYPITSSAFPGSFDVRASTTAAKVTWPNEVSETSGPAFVNATSGLAVRATSVPGGFIVPFKKSQLYVALDVGVAGKLATFQVSSSGGWFGSNKYFYHRALWKDIDGDGDLDLLTARSDYSVPPLGSFTGQLLWLENPGAGGRGVAVGADVKALAAKNANGDVSSLLKPWTEHVIDDGADRSAGDTNFLVADLDGDGLEEIVATHFWPNGGGAKLPNLVVYSLKAGTVGGWGKATLKGGQVERTFVETGFGGAFDVELVDLDGDGRKEILTSNHNKVGQDAVVVAFEVPLAYKTAPWKNHTLARGFVNRVKDGMSPGAVQSFYPSAEAKAAGKRPWLVVSGDGAGAAYVMRPLNETSGSWGYELLNAYDTASDDAAGAAKTTGGIALGTSPTGCARIYVPAYEAGSTVVLDGCAMEANLDAMRRQTLKPAKFEVDDAAVPSDDRAAVASGSSAPLVGGVAAACAVLVLGAALIVAKRRAAAAHAPSAEARLDVLEHGKGTLSTRNPLHQ